MPGWRATRCEPLFALGLPPLRCYKLPGLIVGTGMNSVRHRDANGRARMVRLAAFLVLGLSAVGCSSSLLDSSPEPAATPAPTAPSPSFGARISSLFGSSKPQPQTTTPSQSQTAGTAATATEIECPVVEIRSGTSTLSVNAAGAEGATALRYQATLGRTARECTTHSGTLNIKVGIQGRIILGPGGGPGQLDLPLRYAVVKEGPEPKTIISKLNRVAVTIPPEQGNVPFTHVEDALSVPLPPQAELDAYVIYIGFDPQGAKVQEKKPPPRRQQQQQR
jgi:hypothetical protein